MTKRLNPLLGALLVSVATLTALVAITHTGAPPAKHATYPPPAALVVDTGQIAMSNEQLGALDVGLPQVTTTFVREGQIGIELTAFTKYNAFENDVGAQSAAATGEFAAIVAYNTGQERILGPPIAAIAATFLETAVVTSQVEAFVGTS